MLFYLPNPYLVNIQDHKFGCEKECGSLREGMLQRRSIGVVSCCKLRVAQVGICSAPGRHGAHIALNVLEFFRSTVR